MRSSSSIFRIILSASIIGCITASCGRQSSEIIPQEAVYYWQNNQPALNQSESEFLKNQEIKKMYVKFFEVEKSGNELIPSAKFQLKLSEESIRDVQIVPTIYIRNELFKNCSEIQIEELAENVFFLITKKFNEQVRSKEAQISEIQIDCDWTISTQKNYFSFLKKFKSKGKFTLSATLRLYPYKFPDKMGVLPVDRAMLMCYNLVSPLEAGSRNSILDLRELKKYLVGAKEYPVALDLALPIYSVALIVQNNHFAGIHYLNNEELKQSLVLEKEPWYFSKVDTVLNNLYLRKGDKVKLETISAERIEDALKIIRKNVTFRQGMSLALFHLQEQQIQQFSHAQISSFYNTFTSH